MAEIHDWMQRMSVNRWIMASIGFHVTFNVGSESGAVPGRFRQRFRSCWFRCLREDGNAQVRAGENDVRADSPLLIRIQLQMMNDR